MSQIEWHLSNDYSEVVTPQVSDKPYEDPRCVGFVPLCTIRDKMREARRQDVQHVLRAVSSLG